LLNREKLADSIKDAAGKAGTLVMAALVVACCALLISAAALVSAVRGRAARAG